MVAEPNDRLSDGPSKTLALQREADIVAARQAAKELAAALGFDLLDQVQLATAVSELARNVIQYAGQGEITLAATSDRDRRGLELVCRDSGPGIADLELAISGGYSTGRGLGRGLSGAKALLDEFRVDIAQGQGTTVWGRKWLR